MPAEAFFATALTDVDENGACEILLDSYSRTSDKNVVKLYIQQVNDSGFIDGTLKSTSYIKDRETLKKYDYTSLLEIRDGIFTLAYISYDRAGVGSSVRSSTYINSCLLLDSKTSYIYGRLREYPIGFDISIRHIRT